MNSLFKKETELFLGPSFALRSLRRAFTRVNAPEGKEEATRGYERPRKGLYMGGRGSSSGMTGGGSNPFPDSMIQDTVFHGTNVADITEFSIGGRESSGAIFFGKEEDYAEEEAYLKHERSGGEQTMYEVKIDVRNPLEVTLPPGQFADNHVEARYIRQAKAAGHDSVIFHSNTGDPYLDDTFYAVFSPKQVKIMNRRKI